MTGVFTGLFIIIILFIKLNKLAGLNHNVKQEQPKATEVSEWNLASLTVCIVLFDCWLLLRESLFSWYIWSTHMPQHHEKGSNTAVHILHWVEQVCGAMGSKENQCAIEKKNTWYTQRYFLFRKKVRNKTKARSSELLTEWYHSTQPLERCVTCSLDCHNTLGCCKNSWQCLTDRRETCDPKLWCFPFHDEMNAALDRGWNTSVCGGSAILGPFLLKLGLELPGISRALGSQRGHCLWGIFT